MESGITIDTIDATKGVVRLLAEHRTAQRNLPRAEACLKALCSRQPLAEVKLPETLQRHLGLLIGKKGRQIRSVEMQPGCNVELKFCSADGGSVTRLACWPCLAGVVPDVEFWTEAIFRDRANQGLQHALRKLRVLVEEHRLRMTIRQFEMDVVRKTWIT